MKFLATPNFLASMIVSLGLALLLLEMLTIGLRDVLLLLAVVMAVTTILLGFLSFLNDGVILRAIKLFFFNRKFRKRNGHNMVTANSNFPIDNVQVGNMTYGSLDVIWMAPKWAKIKIGNYCSIGPAVKFLVGGVHDYKRISTFPFQTKIYKKVTPPNTIGCQNNLDIVIEDDVWIGYNSLIMSGVIIGKGSVIGARSIVAKDVPPYSIVIGNKIVKQRFDPEIIEKIKDINYSSIVHRAGDGYEKYCMDVINDENVDIIKNFFIKDE